VTVTDGWSRLSLKRAAHVEFTCPAACAAGHIGSV